MVDGRETNKRLFYINNLGTSPTSFCGKFFLLQFVFSGPVLLIPRLSQENGIEAAAFFQQEKNSGELPRALLI